MATIVTYSNSNDDIIHIQCSIPEDKIYAHERQVLKHHGSDCRFAILSNDITPMEFSKNYEIKNGMLHTKVRDKKSALSDEELLEKFNNSSSEEDINELLTIADNKTLIALLLKDRSKTK